MGKFLTRPAFILSSLAGLFLLLAAFFTFGLHYDFMRSDVYSYWQESVQWTTPYNEHPPLYALSIALLRARTFNILPPIALMMGINLAAFILCALLILQISRAAGLGAGWAMLAAVLFGLWPFVGLNYAVVPLADLPSMALTLAGVFCLQRSRQPWAAIFFGLAIVTHKGVWPLIGMITLADFYMRREYFSKSNIFFLAITLLPLTALWVAGAFYHHSANWLMERSLRVNTSISGGYPILDGLFSTFGEGGLKGLVKGSIVLVFLALAIAGLLVSIKLKFKHYEFTAAISLAILVMFLFSSADTIWGPVRFSRFLAFPLVFWMSAILDTKPCSRAGIYTGAFTLLGLILTQFAYAWYIAVVFYG